LRCLVTLLLQHRHPFLVELLDDINTTVAQRRAALARAIGLRKKKESGKSRAAHRSLVALKAHGYLANRHQLDDVLQILVRRHLARLASFAISQCRWHIELSLLAHAHPLQAFFSTTDRMSLAEHRLMRDTLLERFVENRSCTHAARELPTRRHTETLAPTPTILEPSREVNEHGVSVCRTALAFLR
jgi:hypothetical protein